MHELAQSLNDTIRRESPQVYDTLSELGKKLYFPKEGILSQSAEAKEQATRFNATIGIATEHGHPMHLDVIQRQLSNFAPEDLFNYAPPAGKPLLRSAWRDKLLEENPAMRGKSFGTPIVTNALTHGLAIVADLFVDAGDPVILPDKNWENYALNFEVRCGAEIVTYPLYNDRWQFNADGLQDALLAQKERGRNKAVVVLNFPNNPTGYTPSVEEGDRIVDAIVAGAEAGIHVLVVTDDAYFFLFYEDSLKESLFGKLLGRHPNILPIKVDGATKEEFVWGFRVGFLTYGAEPEAVQKALEQKTMGLIRATISSGPHPSQSIVLAALRSPEFPAQKQAKFEIMKSRANRVKDLLASGRFDDAWTYYPFNSGYFMCLNLLHVEAEALRRHLLGGYGIGTIALGQHDLRIAFSCIEEEDIDELFETLYHAAKELEADHSAAAR